jgi:hypothetical protein
MWYLFARIIDIWFLPGLMWLGQLTCIIITPPTKLAAFDLKKELITSNKFHFFQTLANIHTLH